MTLRVEPRNNRFLSILGNDLCYVECRDLGVVHIRVTPAAEPTATNSGRKSRWDNSIMDCIALTSFTYTRDLRQVSPSRAYFEPSRDLPRPYST